MRYGRGGTPYGLLWLGATGLAWLCGSKPGRVIWSPGWRVLALVLGLGLPLVAISWICS